MFATRRELMIGTTGLVLAGSLAGCSNAGGGDTSGEDASDMAIGATDAKVRVIEYASITCPHCASFHKQVWPQLRTNYIDTGKIRFVFREFPTPPQEVALAGFQVARCAAAGNAERYFAVIEVLFEQQEAIFAAMGKNAVREELLRIAQAAGVSPEAFEQCISDPEAAKRVTATVAKAQKLKVDGTPSIFINGEKQGTDALSYEGLSKLLDAKLAAG